MNIINPITAKLYSDEFKKFKKNEKFFSIPMFQPEIVTEFKEKFAGSDVLILEAQTGAGKSVVAPYHVADMYGFKKKIAMSEPRTVNAVNIAGTLSAQVDSKVGEYVGYMIGSSATGSGNKTSKNTKITVMTDALLFQQMTKDLEAYDIIIIDEFHERNVNIDMCLAIIRKYLRMIKREREYWEWRDSLSNLTPQERFSQEVYEYKKIKDYKEYIETYEESGFRRPRDYKNPVKFLLLSATIYAQKYLDYYGEFNVSHMFVAGRSYPIKDFFIEDLFGGNLPEPGTEVDLTIEKLFSHEYETGDVIVFLPGKADIMDYVGRYTGKYEGVLVGGIYRGAPDKEVETLISAVKYKELGYKRRLLFATNIAETGVTIDGLQYVIETGTEKRLISRSGYNELSSQNIAKSSAKQRCGRVGRTSPGTCFHMYSRQTFEEFKGLGRPAIYNENLENLLIKLLVDIRDVNALEDFLINEIPDRLDRVDVETVILRYYHDRIIADGLISVEGKIVASLGLDYKWGLLILQSFMYEIQDVMIPIVAVLSGCSTLKEYLINKKDIEKYRNKLGDPLAAFMIYDDMITGGKVNEGFVPLMGLEVIRKIKDIVDKINSATKEIKDQYKRIDFIGTWRIAIEKFKGEDLDTVIERIASVFGQVFRDRLIYTPYERTYKTIQDIKVSPFDIGPTVDLKVRPSLIGYDSLLKIGNQYIPSYPFILVKKSDFE